MAPYFSLGNVSLYCGSLSDALSELPCCDAIITDPPYGETSLGWDVWPEGWPASVARLSAQMWVFGSMRMFMEKASQFADWRFAQDVVWEKHNGSNSLNDRFRRVHEHALHFYNGAWSQLPKNVCTTDDATSRTVRRKRSPQHWRELESSLYQSDDGGPKMMRSVIYERSCHGYAQNETQKPESLVSHLIEYSTNVGDVIIDFFAGSGTTLAVAAKLGRGAIGVELRESQCEIIAKRIERIGCELPLASSAATIAAYDKHAEADTQQAPLFT
jgi:site-specific DNA-methyltransferase (adenine-specific)